MKSIKYFVILLGMTLFLIPSAFSFGISPASAEFNVISNKTYSDDFCIIDTYENKTYYLYGELKNAELFDYFTINQTNITAKETGEKLCVRYSFKIISPKAINENKTNYHIIVSGQDPSESSAVFGMKYKINVNSFSIDYKNPLFRLSINFISFFISIFAVLGLLLYIIRSKKLNE